MGKPLTPKRVDMINSGREWDWIDDIIEDGIDDYISVPTGSNPPTCIED